VRVGVDAAQHRPEECKPHRSAGLRLTASHEPCDQFRACLPPPYSVRVRLERPGGGVGAVAVRRREEATLDPPLAQRAPCDLHVVDEAGVLRRLRWILTPAD